MESKATVTATDAEKATLLPDGNNAPDSGLEGIPLRARKATCDGQTADAGRHEKG